MFQAKYDISLRTVLSNFTLPYEVLICNPAHKYNLSFGCQPDEPLASLVTTNRIINVYVSLMFILLPLYTVFHSRKLRRIYDLNVVETKFNAGHVGDTF